MISVNIAYDNQDEGLGSFFEQCKDDLTSFLENMQIDGGDDYDVHEIHSGRCNVVYIGHRISEVNEGNFLFIAYSHGDVECLTVGGISYIDSVSNAQLFNNSFFYSVACSVGAGLGPRLVDHGSHVFIGYVEPYSVPNQHFELFVSCVNVGIKMFLNGESAEESFRLMGQYYDQKIDELMRVNNVLIAGLLARNRSALVFLGTGDLRIGDFNV
jgi:hypothetical protein